MFAKPKYWQPKMLTSIFGMSCDWFSVEKVRSPGRYEASGVLVKNLKRRGILAVRKLFSG